VKGKEGDGPECGRRDKCGGTKARSYGRHDTAQRGAVQCRRCRAGQQRGCAQLAGPWQGPAQPTASKQCKRRGQNMPARTTNVPSRFNMGLPGPEQGGGAARREGEGTTEPVAGDRASISRKPKGRQYHTGNLRDTVGLVLWRQKDSESGHGQRKSKRKVQAAASHKTRHQGRVESPKPMGALLV
jgi:hypothetical protein